MKEANSTHHSNLPDFSTNVCSKVPKTLFSSLAAPTVLKKLSNPKQKFCSHSPSLPSRTSAFAPYCLSKSTGLIPFWGAKPIITSSAPFNYVIFAGPRAVRKGIAKPNLIGTSSKLQPYLTLPLISIDKMQNM